MIVIVICVKVFDITSIIFGLNVNTARVKWKLRSPHNKEETDWFQQSTS